MLKQKSMKFIEAGEVHPHTSIFSITPYSSVGTIDEFEEFVNNVIRTARNLDGTISIDVRKDDFGNTMQVDFIVKGKMKYDEQMAKFHNDTVRENLELQEIRDKNTISEILERNPDVLEYFKED